MKVIKDGILMTEIPKWSTTVECEKGAYRGKEGCGAIVEIEVKDIVLAYYKGNGNKHRYYAFKCPQCEKYSWVCIPNHLRYLLDKKFKGKTGKFDGTFGHVSDN